MARWLLQRAGIAYVEEMHAPLLHVIATLSVNGGLEAPVIVTSTEIWRPLVGVINAIDAVSPEGRRVYGETSRARSENQALLNEVLADVGSPVRQFMYNRILPMRSVMEPVATAGAPLWERLCVSWFYPIWRRLLAQALGISPQVVAAAPGLIWSGFDRVEAALRDRGGPFLGGESPCGVDIVIAAMLAPVVMPPEYGGRLPPFDQLPADLQAFVTEARSRIAGHYVLRVYREARG
jgi:glutathione S-transferase